MKSTSSFLILTILGSLVCAAAEIQSADKSGFTLFHPTPDALMRELSPDRPDKTDSPRTVDAGHISIEMDFFNFGRFRDEDNGMVTRTHVYQAAPMNLKVGLLNSVDFQTQISPYSWKSERILSPASQTRTTGFGDVIPRLKVNLLGNDGEGFALAVMPFVKIPTGRGRFSSDEFEGGLKVPYAFGVPGWEIGLQAELDVNHDQVGSDYHPHLVNSISIGRAIWGRLGCYVEYFSDVSTERGAGFVSTFDTWFTYSVNKNLRLEAGAYIGLTRASEPLHPFLGMSFRY